MLTTQGIAFGFMAAASVLLTSLVVYSHSIGRMAERVVPPDGQFVDVHGARLHYLDRGAGPVVILVHGLTGQLRNFNYGLVNQLAEDHRVIAVDRPGSGYSRWRSRGGRGIEAQAEVLSSFIAELGLAPVLLVGHSLGGAVALSLALKRPSLLIGLALIAPLTQAEDKAPAVFRPLTIASPTTRFLIARVLAAPIGRLKHMDTLRAVFGPEPVPDDFGVRGGGILALRPTAFAAASAELREVAGEMDALVGRYGELDVPLAILFGRDDQILSPELHGARTIAMIPGATLNLIDGGHMIPVTAADVAADWIRSLGVRLRSP